ncbi:MAG: hypothetical protein U1F34_05230 [Gammaproteobacteria bacterium]
MKRMPPLIRLKKLRSLRHLRAAVVVFVDLELSIGLHLNEAAVDHAQLQPAVAGMQRFTGKNWPGRA